MAKRKESDLLDQPEAADEPGIGSAAGAPEAPAGVLYAYLRTSGTPVGTLRPLAVWLHEQAPRVLETEDVTTVTAEDVYRWLEEQHVTLGTRRKAGKWIWGRTYEPEDGVSKAPQDEILRLRAENDQLSAQVNEASARRLGLEQQNAHLHRRVAEMQTQLQILTAGRSPAEMTALGLNAPVGST